MRSRRKKLCVVLLLLILFLYIVLLLFQWHLDTYPDKLFTFNLINTPYARLENGTCVLQTSGQWNCPDIRTQGPSKLRQSQLVMTRMLLMFDALAKKHNLRYWITRGTLLGAARHKGFIPWDIDLDIEMPIEDYLRFLGEGVKELPLDTILQQHTTEQSLSKTDADHLHELSKAVLSPWNPRLRDKKSCYMTCMKKKCNWQDGLMIDIYPIVLRDGYFTDQFALSTRVWRYLGIDRGVQYKAYPLQRLEFEGFQLPAPNEWKQQLLVTYGEFYMDLPPVEKQYPPDGTVPEPNMTCPGF